MDLVHLFTSFDGRISRQPFWIAWVIFFAIEAAGMFALPVVDSARLSSILSLLLIYPQFAVSLKRAYDRNMPTWVIGLFFALDVAFEFLFLAGWITERDLANPPPLAMSLLLPIAVFALALLIELGFRRGTVGPNRYGPDPLDASGPPK
jgi:uncharacterized membrane protein YhaH (DUF805 family)